MTHAASPVAALLLAVMLASPGHAVAGAATDHGASPRAATGQGQDPGKNEAELRAALGGEEDAAARAELAALLLRQGRDGEIAEILPPAADPQGLAEARSLLCRAAEDLDDVRGREGNARLQAILSLAALRVGDGVTRPEILTRTRPEYTAEARAAKISGSVILSAVIDELGQVAAVEILKGLPMGLDTAAAEAVREWTFKPATLEGMPVAVCYSLTVSFQTE